MREELYIAAITGPAGSGKSTVAFQVKKQTKNCVNIVADDVKHFIGFDYDTTPKGVKKWRFEHWELLGESIGLLARTFHKADFNVIINGYINEPAWIEIQKQVKLTHKILLLPRVDVVIKRDLGRKKDVRMGGKAVKDHHDYFSNSNYFDDFIKIDSTNHTMEQTVEKVKALLDQNRGEP